MSSLFKYDVSLQLQKKHQKILTAIHSYNALKNHLTNHKAITIVQQEIENELEYLLEQEQKESANIITKEFLARQNDEDLYEANKDRGIAIYDETTRQDLIAKQKHFNQLKKKYYNELAHFDALRPSDEPSFIAKALSYFYPNPSSLNSLQEINIDDVERNLQEIADLLSNLSTEMQNRALRRTERESRLIAKAKWEQNNSLSIASLLSEENKILLQEKINKEAEKLTAKCHSLINEANSNNYILFIDRLKKLLPFLQYTAREQQAIRRVIKLMEQYQRDTNEVYKISQSIRLLKLTLDNYLFSNEDAKKQIDSLRTINAKLLVLYKELETTIKELCDEKEKDDNKISTLRNLLIIIAVSFFVVIPSLIAGLSFGLIPFTLAIYSASTLSTILIPTALGLFIAANNYDFDSSTKKIEINAHKESLQGIKQQIETRKNTIRNFESDSSLYDQNISSYKQEIKQQENLMLAKQSTANEMLSEALKIKLNSHHKPHKEFIRFFNRSLSKLEVEANKSLSLNL